MTEQANNQKTDVQQMVFLFREVQIRVAYLSGEMGVFLDLIEERATGISNKVLEKAEEDSLPDDEKGSLESLEEDADDIGRSVEVLRDRIGQIQKTISDSMQNC